MTRHKKMGSAIFAALIVLVCAVCPSLADTKILSPSQVNSDPAQFEGREITVRGYVVLALEAHILYESKSLNDKWRAEVKANKASFDPKAWSKYCLTIANPGLLNQNEKRFAGKTLVLKGTLLSHYLDSSTIDLGACPRPTAIQIDEDDFKRRYLDSN